MTPTLFQSWSAARIADVCGGMVAGDVTASATGISNDTRTLAPGDLFVALVAARDGHDYLEAARAAGARVFLVQRDGVLRPAAGEALVRVADTTRALGDIARALWAEHGALQPERFTCAITGSNGKTTTKDFVGRLLVEAFGAARVLVTRGNLNSQIGLPMTLAALTAEHTHVVLEMGASRRGDIAELVAMAPPARALVTSVGAAHLEGLGDLAGVAAEKGSIFAGVAGQPDSAPAVAVVPAEWRDELLPAGYLGEVRAVGDAGAGELYAEVASYEPRDSGARVALDLAGQHFEATLAAPGRHNARNFAAALALLWDVLPEGARETHACRVADAPPAAAGRSRWRQTRVGGWLLDDTYNANPGSVAAGLSVLAERPGSRWAILGDMLELGEASAAAHERAGAQAAEAGCARVWGVGAEAARIGAGAEAGGVADVATFADAASCAEAAREAVTANDVVFVKGSRGVGLERVVHALVEEGA